MKITESQSGAVGDVDAGPYRFERRQAARSPMAARATAFELAGDGFGRTHALQTVDCSASGVGAICDTAIHPGTCVTIGFDRFGGAARRGVVARCQPCGNGYRVAVVFEGRLAA